LLKSISNLTGGYSVLLLTRTRESDVPYNTHDFFVLVLITNNNYYIALINHFNLASYMQP